MRNCATYDAHGGSMTDCKKINFVYGPNGSGKSTISNYLQNCDDTMFSDCQIKWDSTIHPDIVVYNRKFREQNFSNTSDIAGVFTLGQATIEDIKRLDALKERRKQRKSQFDKDSESYKKRDALRTKNRDDFKETIWNVILRDQGHQFLEAFSGSRKSKERFLEQVLERYKHKNPNVCSLMDLENRKITLFGKKPEVCAGFVFQIDHTIDEINRVERDPIFQRVVAGNNDIPVGALIQSLNNGDWVNRGRQYVSESNVCPFCQKPTIDEDFRNQIEAFFSGEYDRCMTHIGTLYRDYERNTQSAISALEAIVTDTNKCTVGKLDIVKFTEKIHLLDEVYKRNLAAISEKKQEPGKLIALKYTSDIITALTTAVLTANKSIAEHNQMVANFRNEHKKLVDDVWDYFLDQQDALISGYLSDDQASAKALAGMQKKLVSLKNELDRLKQEIAEAGRNVTSVQPTVDEINRSLAAYGFNNFCIVPSAQNANMYQIQRPDGTLASNTLSEGEETFITFLYYLQLAKGSVNAATVSNRKILVIDDPICSLDSTILYVVSAMVKELIKEVKTGESNIEQIFILTHNIFFHKEASFVNGRTTTETTVNYWIIRKNENKSIITAYGQENPISTTYELLWKELKSASQISLISMQNTMRRIIENYFSMLGNNKEDFVINSFATVEDQVICRSLFHWINDGSHSIPDDLYYSVHSASPEKYKEIFKKVFEVTGHLAHYNMMMGIEN